MTNIILGFDVSNQSCSVAISQGENILAYEEELRPFSQAERLVMMIESVLSAARLTYQDIEYLALTNGPGSFTGIRIGLAVAKGIMIASNHIKALTISNFDMAYYRAIAQVGSWDKIFVLLDAYRGQIYFQEFNKLSIVQNLPPQLLDIDLVRQIIASAAGNSSTRNEFPRKVNIVCIGSGLITVVDQIKDFDNITILPRFKIIKAIHICRYAQVKITQKESLEPIEPLYIRPPDATIPSL